MESAKGVLKNFAKIHGKTPVTFLYLRPFRALNELKISWQLSTTLIICYALQALVYKRDLNMSI